MLLVGGLGIGNFRANNYFNHFLDHDCDVQGKAYSSSRIQANFKAVNGTMKKC